jgi:hypothetical protein
VASVAEFIVPPLEGDGEWPSLGSQVGEWQEANLGFGPGDLLGQPYKLDDEDWAFNERMYQVYPPQHSGPCRFAMGRCEIGRICGRRRFDTAVIMLRKGSKKSERLASIGAAELAEDGPVRCDGFRREGGVWVPVGRPVTSPFVFILAFAKEQAEDTSWDAMRAMISRGAGADKFDVWEDKIVRRGGDGEAKALATAPDSRDGGKTTFQGKEEGHRWTFPRQREAHQTTRANLSKRPIAEPWELHATTAYAPGEASVIETIHDAARKLSGEAARTSRLFFFYRWADDKLKIRNDDGGFDVPVLLKAIDQASGPVIRRWSEAEPIAQREFLGVDSDTNYAERVWLNRIHRSSSQAFNVELFKKLGEGERPVIEDGAVIVVAWHGARYADAAGFVATDVLSGYQWIPEFEDGSQACWEQPADRPDGWEVPEDEVEAAAAAIMGGLNVWGLYVNPAGWESVAARWAATYGDEVVKAWWTNRWTEVSRATRAYQAAIASSGLTHSGAPELVRAIGAAHRFYLTTRDEDGKPIWVIRKERADSPHPVNLAHAALMSWQARLDALKAGAAQPLQWTVA